MHCISVNTDILFQQLRVIIYTPRSGPGGHRTRIYIYTYTCVLFKEQPPGWCLGKHQPTLLWTFPLPTCRWRHHPAVWFLPVYQVQNGCSALSGNQPVWADFPNTLHCFFHKYLVLVISPFYFFLSRLLFPCKSFLCIPDISTLSALNIANNFSCPISFLLTYLGFMSPTRNPQLPCN